MTRHPYAIDAVKSRDAFNPRPPQTAWQRERVHGRIEPMDRPGLLARLFAR